MSVEMISTIGRNLEDSLGYIMQNSDLLKRSSQVQDISNWYQELKGTLEKYNLTEDNLDDIPDAKDIAELARAARQSHDAFFSKLANVFMEKISKHVDIPFVDFTIHNIIIKTEGSKKKVDFEAEFDLEPIKPYVKFTFKIGPMKAIEVKATFQIDSSVTISHISFTVSQSELRIHNGRLDANVTLSLASISSSPSVSIDKMVKLASKDFEMDLSGFHFDKTRSVQCANCKTMNRTAGKFCGKCGKNI